MIELLLQPEIWAIFVTLFALEVILGVDNVVFISILCERLPQYQRKLALKLGIGLAVIARILLVFSISWVMSLTQPLISIVNMSFTGRDLIMVLGGAFLLVKSLKELWHWLMYTDTGHTTHATAGLAIVLLQIVAVDIVFSMDSVITAVGLTDNIPIMVAAIIASAVVMVLSADNICQLVTKFPGFKTLALLFLVMLGGLLIAEGFDIYINKGYIYFAMAFGLSLEVCHIRRKQNKPINVIQKISLNTFNSHTTSTKC